MGIYIVSACLVGNNCKYNGGNNYNAKIIEFLKDKEYITICPEVMGGLPIPRYPSEIISTNPLKLINTNNEDVTNYFINGALKEWEKIKNKDIVCAILKEKSPSCGINYIYDGTFSNTLINGTGVFANLLKTKGIKIYSENTFLKEID